MQCPGNTKDHCCYINGKTCQYLEENTVPGRRWACQLRRIHGSWDVVHALPEYAPVRQRLRAIDFNMDCGDWPRPGEICHTCGGVG
jgi:hypothetical protein